MFKRKPDTFISNKVTAGKHSTELFSEATMDFINDHESDKPFFAYVSYMAPHDPRTMPDEFRDMYDADEIKVPENFMAYHPIEYANTQCRDEVLTAYPRTIEETKLHLAEYYAMITHIDDEIGKIIKCLEDKGELDNTIIIFTADNGLALGQHGLFGKQCHYEHSIRVPFVMAGPEIPSGETRDDYIYVLDIFPTLCDMLNIDIPSTVEGKSFLGGIKGIDYNKRKRLYFAYTDKIRSVKDNQFKLMQHVYGNKVTTQLFDLKNDPWEMANLVGQPEYKEKVVELTDLMNKYNEEWKDDKHPLGHSYWSQLREITGMI